MSPLRRAAVAILLAALPTFTAAVPVNAALLWSLTASPLAVPTGVPTTFTLTAANLLLGRIECVVVNVPANFSVAGVSVLGSTAGDSWVGARNGNQVRVWTTSGGDRLELLDNVRFTITATALSGGSLAWSSNAYSRGDCGGSGSLVGVPPIVLVTGPAVTPTPAPSPPPSPAPTPPPTPAPTSTPSPAPTTNVPPPTDPEPAPRPSLAPPDAPGPTAAPQEASPTPSGRGAIGSGSPAPSDEEPAGGSASASPSPDPFAGEPGAAGTPPDGTLAEGRPGQPEIAFDARELDLGFGVAGLIGGIEIWAVPAATIGVPGLLVLLWAVLQSLGALAWVPAARRLRGDDRSARRDRG